MSNEQRDANERITQWALALGAVESGSTTSVAVAEATGMSVVSASARLRDLEMMGVICRTGRTHIHGKGTNGGRPATEWRTKNSGW